MPTIRLEDVAKLYKDENRRKASAIVDINLTIEQGEFIFFVGSRGAGKSTLMRIISGDIAPDRGTVYLDDVNMTKLSMRRLRDCIGKVPQESELVRTDSIYNNLATPRPLQEFSNNVRKGIRDISRAFHLDKPGAARRRVQKAPPRPPVPREPSPDGKPDESVLISKALGLVGMGGTEERYPLEFSISDCKRIELAKAIMHSPPILMLDEITERMDDDTTWDIIHLLTELNNMGTTILFVTNNSQFINIMRKRVITLADGKIVGDVRKGRYGYVM